MVRLRASADPLDATALALLENALAASTVASYSAKFAAFARFCHRFGSHPLAPPPGIILRYQAHMFEERRVHPRNWRPYLACINRAHDDFGLPAPARSRVVSQATRGALRLSESWPHTAPLRRPLPAATVSAAVVLAACLKPEARGAPLLVAMAVIFFLRASSLAYVEPAHFSFLPNGVLEVAIVKHKTRLATVLVRTLPPASPLLVNFIAALRDFVASCPGGVPVFPLSQDAPSVGLSAAVGAVLHVAGAQPPPGTLWSGHSCRAGGATAALSIGVSLPMVMQWGDWRSLTSVQRYLDALVAPSPAAFSLFGHLRRDTLLPDTP